MATNQHQAFLSKKMGQTLSNAKAQQKEKAQE